MSEDNDPIMHCNRFVPPPIEQAIIEQNANLKKVGAKKLDAGKLPVMRGVITRFPLAMQEIARVSQVGTTKYAVPISDRAYKDVPDGLGRYEDAIARHTVEEQMHGAVNIERGGALPAEGVALFHKAQRAWDALASLEIFLTQLQKAGQPTDPQSYLVEVQNWERGVLIEKEPG